MNQVSQNLSGSALPSRSLRAGAKRVGRNPGLFLCVFRLFVFNCRQSDLFEGAMSEYEDLQALTLDTKIELLHRAHREIEYRLWNRVSSSETILFAGRILKRWPKMFEECNEERLFQALDDAVRHRYPRGTMWARPTLETLIDKEASVVCEVGYDYPMPVSRIEDARVFVSAAWKCLNAMHRQGRLKV